METRATPRLSSTHASSDLDVANAAPIRRPWLWIVSAIVLVLAAQLIIGIVTNKNFEWHTVAQYITAPMILKGLATTLVLAAICMLLGIILGLIVAAFQRSRIPVLHATGVTYVWIFRGLPVLVQLIFWFNLGALLPHLSIGIPFGPEFASWPTSTLVTASVAAVLGLSLNEGAYMAEIIRAGLLSVEVGQYEAAQALGFGRAHTFRRILLPQAMRFIIPPTGTQVINMVKGTSLVSVIAMADLLYSAQIVYNRTFETIPLLVVACLWYLIVTSVLYGAQSLLERRFSRGASRRAGPARRLRATALDPKAVA